MRNPFAIAMPLILLSAALCAAGEEKAPNTTAIQVSTATPQSSEGNRWRNYHSGLVKLYAKDGRVIKEFELDGEEKDVPITHEQAQKINRDFAAYAKENGWSMYQRHWNGREGGVLVDGLFFVLTESVNISNLLVKEQPSGELRWHSRKFTVTIYDNAGRKRLSVKCKKGVPGYELNQENGKWVFSIREDLSDVIGHTTEWRDYDLNGTLIGTRPSEGIKP